MLFGLKLVESESQIFRSEVPGEAVAGQIFMDKQPSSVEILKKTLRTLASHTPLLPEEVAQLRLADLHLAGKSPHISFSPAGSDQTRKIELDLDVHRALVGWLVARPDSVTDLLFPGDESDGLTADYIEAVVGTVHAAPKPATDTPEPPAADETMFSSPRPGPPVWPPAAPPPQSMPEMDRPPEGPPRPFSRPPTTAPEGGMPFPPVTPLPNPPESGPEEVSPESGSDSRPFPPRPFGPRVPPKPVRKREDEPPAPSIVKQKPEQTSLSEAGLPVTTPIQPEPAPEPVAAEPPPVEPPADADETLVAAPPLEPPAAVEEQPAQPAERESAPPEQPPIKPPPLPPQKHARPLPAKPPRTPARGKLPAQRSATLPVALSGVLAAVLICVLCVGAGGGYYLLTSESGGDLLAGLGLAPAPVELPAELPETPAAPVTAEESSVFESPVSPVDTPTATATLPPTSTPTLLPTETATPEQTPTPVPPTEPPPTDTPVPTPTATTAPPTAAPAAEADTPTPEATATPAMKYNSLKLLGPDDGTRYDGINEVLLKWEPVPDLAADEQYAVRIMYRYNGQITYGGANVKEPQWVVPLQLYKKIDPPDNLYEWFVVVERLNSDGSGTAISPESEHRHFTWK